MSNLCVVESEAVQPQNLTVIGHDIDLLYLHAVQLKTTKVFRMATYSFGLTPKGAEASAIIYSVTAPACANGLNIEEYLTNVFKSRGSELFMPR